MSEEYLALGKEGFGRHAFAGAPVFLGRADGTARPLLLRGFADGHIHGGFGVDVMEATAADLRRLDARLRDECGYDGWLPTTVACGRDDALRVLDLLPDVPGILGLHLEGPFLSPKHPGAQPKAALTDYPGPGSPWDAVLDHPRLRVVTLAPEIPGGLDLIRRLAARGVIASLGHTDATAEETDAAIAAGARRATHAFNAMRPLHHREVGIVGRLLTGSPLAAEVIFDGVHVHPDAARLLPRPFLPVSDGTKAIGLPPGTRLSMWGLDCVVGEGDVRIAATGALAGAALSLREGFALLVRELGPEEALACAGAARESLGVPESFGGWIAFDPRGGSLRRLA